MKDVDLRIDFQAALAKLAPAQLQGSWQLPAELTRLAIASGARSVELDLRRSKLVMRAPGAKLDLVALRDFRDLLDHRLDDGERHAALVNLEERDALALAALGGSPGEMLQLRSGDLNGWTLRAAAGRRPVLKKQPPRGGGGFELRLQGLSLDTTAAEQWLWRNARFAPVPISIGGQPIFRGFRRPLIRIRLREPLPVALAVAERGEVPRLWLLRHGMICTRATVPGYPPFEAAVEMAGVSAPGATSAALREAVQPYLEPLVQAAVGLIAQLARHADTLRGSARERAAHLLLEAARRERYRDRLKTVRVFHQIVNEDGTYRLVSIADLEYLIRFDDNQGRGLDALAPEQDPDEYALAGRQVLVLSSSERTLLAEILGATFQTPAVRARSRRSLRRFGAEARSRFSLAWQRLRGGVVDEAQLDAAEKELLTAVQQAMAGELSLSVRFCAGAGAIHVTGDGQLLLPRRNPVVEASVRAVGRDSSWLYPVLMALLDGHDLPPSALRETWRNPPAELAAKGRAMPGSSGPAASLLRAT